VPVDAAASMIRHALVEQVSAKLRSSMELHGYGPAEFTMLLLGGNSALHACAMADELGIRRLMAFQYSPVFAAFGSNITDVEHRYRRMKVAAPGGTGPTELQESLEALVSQASRDMVGEGFDGATVSAHLEIEVRVGDATTRYALDPVNLANIDVSKMAAEIESTWSTSHGVLEAIDLMVRAPLSHWEPMAETGAGSTDVAPIGTRVVSWDGIRSSETSIYDASALAHGTVLDGPAIIETPIANYAIAAGWQCEVDPRGTLVLSKSG
jgi:N-methylhydantoinase A